jgi:hypothetical protein
MPAVRGLAAALFLALGLVVLLAGR